jgi:hypothetical protein
MAFLPELGHCARREVASLAGVGPLTQETAENTEGTVQSEDLDEVL